jgi:hypothetical protein
MGSGFNTPVPTGMVQLPAILSPAGVMFSANCFLTGHDDLTPPPKTVYLPIFHGVVQPKPLFINHICFPADLHIVIPVSGNTPVLFLLIRPLKPLLGSENPEKFQDARPPQDMALTLLNILIFSFMMIKKLRPGRQRLYGRQTARAK